jgi:cytochrome c biogenesis protein CcmG/thiol:disulfide interchange protein DsbE
VALTAVLVRLRQLDAGTQPSEATLIERGRPAPAIVGTTLDGAPFDLASLRGRPVIVNFWGPSCIPCRDEFPLFTAKLAEHGEEAPAIVGILMHDPPAPARDFIAELGATWPTVDDPEGAIRAAYRVAARPQSYFIDRDGILRAIQVGELDEATFERQYALIGPTSAPPSAPSAGPSGAPSGGAPGSSP